MRSDLIQELSEVCSTALFVQSLPNTTVACAVKGAGPQWVQLPPGNWFAPSGSNRSSGRGNEVAEAFGVEGRLGDLASVQAVIRVNVEQASKLAMQEPTRPNFGEG